MESLTGMSLAMLLPMEGIDEGVGISPLADETLGTPWLALVC
ncbi:hypothetical protein GPAL_0032 [Glaciecola pallidula DSM 14239 = ACAM 615]|uniref:Uncharacterized protein n=1 Tax=Brumicola pallidula DSM 14239 = ACAM 615 TaxID=1121922 RepID=K6ZD82_9ALTE|nr:hypothetical protein GPAL_0032 [Glaciecola pallidula DSM 14239 = ACAM 615]